VIPRMNCRSFVRLTGEAHDRELSSKEVEFVNRHRTTCEACAEREHECSSALDMLRQAVLDVAPGSGFNDRVIRMARVNRRRESLRYWAPAIAGAGIAVLTLFATMQLVTRPMDEPSSSLTHGTASRLGDKKLPTLVLDDIEP
jgi:hypothetical protein